MCVCVCVCVCCLQVNGPVTGGTYKWGEMGLISGEGDLCPDVSFCCCFTGKWTCNWGNLYVGGGRLIREIREIPHPKESVKSVNKLLSKYSKQHQWSLVRHSKITEKVLNRGGLQQ